jgi:alanyl aminopeptidase
VTSIAAVLRTGVLALLLGAVAVPSQAGGGVLRLPEGVRATSQSVFLDLDPAKLDYRGSVRIDLTVAAARPDICFHALRVDMKTITLRGAKTALPLVAKAEDEEGFVRAKPIRGGSIAPGRYTLEIEFENDFDERAISLYRLKVADVWYAFTQFEAADARAAFPCFDEPSVKIPYQIEVRIPAGLDAVSNTPIVSNRAARGARTVRFQRTKPLPSYLLALAIGEFEYTPIPGTSVPARVVTLKGKRHLTAPVVALTPPLLAALERYFGRRYPYEKLDLIAVPEYTYGAMENPGAITYSDQYLLFDAKSMSAQQRRTLAQFTAHELSHMWFGDLVTMEWWNDLWLNESFAEWMGDRTVGEVYPEFDLAVAGLSETEKAYAEDSRLTARAIRQEVTNVVNLLQNADALTYQKGQSVIGMLERWLGPDTFRRGVLTYLKRHQWGNASEGDLWRALSEASGRDVAAVGASYFDQPGIPLVRAELLAGGAIRLRQSRFLNFGLRDSVERRWSIPIVMRYPTLAGTREQVLLLRDAEATIQLSGLSEPPPWIQLNANQTGYYRWRVVGDDAMSRLAEDAVSVLSPRERYGFLLNATALLKSGDMPGDEYAKLLLAFGEDPDPSVVNAVADGVKLMSTYFVTEDLEAPFASYVHRALGGALERIGTSPAAAEPPTAAEARPSLFALLADEGGDEELRAYAKAQTDRYLRGDAVDPSLLGAYLRTAALDGDAELFERLCRKFENDPVPSERRRLLGAIGSFRRPDLEERALAYNLASSLKPQEHYVILQAFSDRPDRRERSWRWFLANHDQMVKKLPAVYTIYLPWIAAGCEEARIEAAKSFFSDRDHNPPGTEAELLKMIESVEECVGLRGREGARVRRFLREGLTAP